MPPLGKPVIVIPALDEEENIGRTIDLIRATGLDVHVIVANDGSKDRTGAIAAERGCEVVDLPRNVGKGHAFLAGLKRALAHNPSAIVSMDADMTHVSRENLRPLIDYAGMASVRREAKMFVAHYLEQGKGGMHPGSPASSGIRSFSLPAALQLHAARTKSLARGFKLEPWLNEFFREGKTELLRDAAFGQLSAFRTLERQARQMRDVAAAARQLAKRHTPNRKPPRRL